MSDESTTIPETFSKYGCDLTQVERTKDVALFECTANEQPRGYELVIIRHQGGKVIKGKKGAKDSIIPPGEVYPSSSQWGIFGWSFLPSQKEVAYERFASLVRKMYPNKAVRKRTKPTR